MLSIFAAKLYRAGARMSIILKNFFPLRRNLCRNDRAGHEQPATCDADQSSHDARLYEPPFSKGSLEIARVNLARPASGRAVAQRLRGAAARLGRTLSVTARPYTRCASSPRGGAKCAGSLWPPCLKGAGTADPTRGRDWGIHSSATACGEPYPPAPVCELGHPPLGKGGFQMSPLAVGEGLAPPARGN